MRTVLGCALVFALSCGAIVAGQAKIDGKKLVGKWEPVVEKEKEKDKDKKDKAPPGPATVIEFTDKGALSMTVTETGKDTRYSGEYTVEVDKLHVKLKVGDKEVKETLTIKSLTDTQLVTEDSKGKAETLKKK